MRSACWISNRDLELALAEMCGEISSFYVSFSLEQQPYEGQEHLILEVFRSRTMTDHSQ